MCVCQCVKGGARAHTPHRSRLSVVRLLVRVFICCLCRCRSWVVPLDAVAITANRTYVALATKTEIVIYNSDGQKKATVGRRKSKRAQHTDYIAVQLSASKNMYVCAINKNNNHCHPFLPFRWLVGWLVGGWPECV